jgi:ribosome-associated protein
VAKKQFQWVRDGADEVQEDLDTGRRSSSKSARKREADRLDALVRKLLELQPHHWGEIPLNPKLCAALTEGKRLQRKSGVRGGLRRHLLHIAGLLRDEEPEIVEQIAAAAEDRGGPGERELLLMELERWRSRLLQDRDRVIDELVAAHPEADRQRLRKLAMAAQREQREGLPPRAFRQLFAYLREVVGL